MTPHQLRAFVAIARGGSVKAAAQELTLTEAAVSMHVKQLRSELADPLFSRTKSGLAFTPGGLRLASRAVELLGLQDRTMVEVGLAAQGVRLLRIGATSLFAEHAAAGLIEQFTGRARDLEVELGLYRAEELTDLLHSRTLDVTIGPPLPPADGIRQRSFLMFELQVVAASGHQLAQSEWVTTGELRKALWFLGPSAVGGLGAVPSVLTKIGVPEGRFRIFQSDAAALEAVKHSDALGLAMTHTVKADLNNGRLAKVPGEHCVTRHSWSAAALHSETANTGDELLRFLGNPRAIQAMLRSGGLPLTRLRASTHVTLWS